MTTSDNGKVNNKRILRNTILLYFRMLFLMGISLFTSRIVLKTLGVEDYGIYNVVGGIVAVLGFLNTSMASATQRFLNVELGKGDISKIKVVFSTAQFIHFIIAGVVLLFAETIGLWFVNNCMNINPDRMIAANCVYQFSIITFIITVISVPYNAAIISHEKMSVFAYISIIEAALKLVVVYILVIIFYDKLIIYSFMLMLIALVVRFLYGAYCKKNFDECSEFSLSYQKDIMQKMLSFSGWTVFGALGTISHTQGIAIVMNMFFGVVVNAAQGIAMQVTGIVNQFVNNFMTALNPQIVKMYATNDLQSMHMLIKRGSRLGVCLVAFFVIPLYLEVPVLLQLWLTEVPEYTVTFIRIILLTSLSSSYAYPLATSKAATGNIKVYQIVLTTMAWMHLPLAWLFFALGFPPQTAMIIYLIIINIEQIYRIINVCPAIGMPIMDYVKDVIVRCSIMIILAFIPSYTLYYLLPDTVVSNISVLCFAFMNITIAIFMIGVTKDERKVVISVIKSKLHI